MPSFSISFTLTGCRSSDGRTSSRSRVDGGSSAPARFSRQSHTSHDLPTDWGRDTVFVEFDVSRALCIADLSSFNEQPQCPTSFTHRIAAQSGQRPFVTKFAA